MPELSQVSLDKFGGGDIEGAGRAFVIRSVEVEGGLLSNGALSLLQNVKLREQQSHPLRQFVEDQIPTQEGAAEVSQSKASLKIKVARIPEFYTLNIIVPIMLLLLLSWYNFLLVRVGRGVRAKSATNPSPTPSRPTASRTAWRSP